jgi:peptide deformylase
VSAGDSPVQRASVEFVAEFARWRAERGLSKKQLAAAMGFDPSYLSHVEAHRHRPTEDFAKRAEAVLQSGGAIWRRFREYDDLRANSRGRIMTGPPRETPAPETWLPPGAGLVVDREIARLSYVDGQYRCTVRRDLHNAGREPVTGYLIRIAVDRYPNEIERSNAHHRTHPLDWGELGLAAACEGEPMHWRIKTDRDAFKAAWLLFENDDGKFPLYPGRRTTIEYTYHVGADKWGHWFQRAVRLPTRRMRIELDLPMSMRPVVWGVETSFNAPAVPLRTPIEQEIEGDRAVFGWETEDPPLHARFRLEWRFRSAGIPAQREGTHDARPSLFESGSSAPRELPGPADAPGAQEQGPGPGAQMVAAGIVQRGAEVLHLPARWFDLPREEQLARAAVERLTAALDRLSRLHPFTKGIGLAAPQLGHSLAAAVVRPQGSSETIVLVNPRVVRSSAELDRRYEGCLSFFDVRGQVARPLWLTVESVTFTGERIETHYEQAVARLVAHEIDHLDGLLYVDRMSGDAPLVPVEEYDQTGRPWAYGP